MTEPKRQSRKVELFYRKLPLALLSASEMGFVIFIFFCLTPFDYTYTIANCVHTYFAHAHLCFYV